jgi:hypothetical protein
MDEINQGPERNFRLPSRARPWVAAAAAIAGLLAVTTFFVSRGGAHQGHAAPRATAPSKAATSAQLPVIVAASGWISYTTSVPAYSLSGAQPAAAPGTVLVGCDSVMRGALAPNWRAGSLRVGRLWLVAGRQLGYVHLGRAGQATGAPGKGTARSSPVEMLVHVDAGSTVVLRVAAGTPPAFRFSADPVAGGYQVHARGFTFVPCPESDSNSGGPTDLYDIGYSIVPGQTVTAEVLTSPSPDPAWLTFTAQRH